MHYKNGREAKVGDVIVAKNYNGLHSVEIVVALSPGSTSCNLTTVPATQGQLTRTAGECLHQEDAIKFD